MIQALHCMIYLISATPLRHPQSELSGFRQRWSLLWIQPAFVLLVDPGNAGPLRGFNQSWSLYWIQPGLDHLVNYASAGPLVYPAVLVS